MRRPFFFPLMFIPFALLGALAVMLLWNAILPELLSVSEIGYWQSLGLLALARILFGGFHRGPCGPSHQWGGHRLHNLSSEEREQMRDRWRSCCGWSDSPKEKVSE